eukprot:scaffold22381_cov118-Isochrysis_galbana.AAC.12
MTWTWPRKHPTPIVVRARGVIPCAEIMCPVSLSTLSQPSISNLNWMSFQLSTGCRCDLSFCLPHSVAARALSVCSLLSALYLCICIFYVCVSLLYVCAPLSRSLPLAACCCAAAAQIAHQHHPIPSRAWLSKRATR